MSRRARHVSHPPRRRPGSRTPRLLLIGLLVAAIVSFSPSAGAVRGETGAGEPRWAWPVAGPSIVLRGYEAPPHRYGPGHRGIDVEAPPGVSVLAPDEGVVSFTGVVVDRPVISIRHADGLVSSMEPVDAIVAAGTAVTRGQPVGTHVSGGSHCDSCLHLGARKNGEYLSPLALLGGIPRAVLLPAD